MNIGFNKYPRLIGMTLVMPKWTSKNLGYTVKTCWQDIESLNLRTHCIEQDDWADRQKQQSLRAVLTGLTGMSDRHNRSLLLKGSKWQESITKLSLVEWYGCHIQTRVMEVDEELAIVLVAVILEEGKKKCNYGLITLIGKYVP